MANSFFRFKQFTVQQGQSAMKVTTDGCLFGAWCAEVMKNEKLKIENLLDIGAGTGLLTLMAAQKNLVIAKAVEIDAKAAQQARENFAASPWAPRLQVRETDILQFSTEKKYDCIISNPPFYENELASTNTFKNIAHHSHHLKLDELLTAIQHLLTENGIFFLLLPYKRKAETERLLNEKDLFIEKLVVVAPSIQHAPFRFMLKGTRQKPQQTDYSAINICEADKQYTPAFIDLLKDYYLHL